MNGRNVKGYKPFKFEYRGDQYEVKQYQRTELDMISVYLYKNGNPIYTCFTHEAYTSKRYEGLLMRAASAGRLYSLRDECD